MRSIETSSWCGVKAGQLGGRVKLRGTIDVVTLQTLARRDDIASLTAGYGLIVADECHHVPVAAFADAVKQIPVRRWLGLTATPYRRDKLDDLIAMQVGPVRHTITSPREAAHGTPMLPGTTPGGRPALISATRRPRPDQVARQCTPNWRIRPRA
jgi:superfamily II DNA or RNA helicase